MSFILSIISLVFYSGYLLLVAPLSLWMLFNGQTWVGRGLALAGLLSLLIPLLIIRHRRQQNGRKIWGQTAVLLTITIVGFLLVVILSAPSGQPNPDSPVQHRFFREVNFNQYALTNIIPESEQVNLGFLLMTFIDPYITAEQASRVSKLTMAHYREMEQNDDFHELGSAMGLAYRQLYGQPYDVGHYYLYIPLTEQDAPLPALVFLHGSAGNFKAYTWIWSKFAEQQGFVIIAPSYGFGSWDAAGADTVIQAIEDAGTIVDIDPERLYLAGLSNGGLGVSQVAANYPDRFRGLIFLSPVFNTTIVDGPAFQAAWADRPVLIISGEADKRIPISYVRQRADNFRDGRINLTTAYYPNEDHFLTFSQPENIMTTVTTWINQTESPTP